MSRSRSALPAGADAPFTPARHGGYEQVVTVTYRGTARIWSPSGQSPGSSLEEHLECAHRHKTPDEAQECGRRLGEREAAQRNRMAIPLMAARPCDIQASPDRLGGMTGREEAWMRHCAAHGAFERYLHASRAAAEGSAWQCPWSQGR